MSYMYKHTLKIGMFTHVMYTHTPHTRKTGKRKKRAKDNKEREVS